MANTTFKGPVRSQNGFLEWNGTEWVPVQGGGGGGTPYIELVSAYPSLYGGPDNRYSNNPNSNPPTGPTAGTIVQLPQMEVGATCALLSGGGSSNDVWAIKLPTVQNTELSAFIGGSPAMSVVSGDYPEYTATTYIVTSSASGPVDTLYVYGYGGAPFWEVTRLPNATIPGFGTIAIFIISTVPITYRFPIADPFVYPFSQVIPAAP